MSIKVPLGQKFIIGFIIVVATVAFVPNLVGRLEMPDWLREPVTFLTAIVIGLSLGSILTRNLTKHFQKLTKAAVEISAGNLTAESYPSCRKKIFQDETTDLESALCQMHKSLKELVKYIKNTSLKLTKTVETMNKLVNEGQQSSEAVSAGASNIFKGALEQANHINSASRIIKDVANLADETAQKVSDTANSSAKANSMVLRGANTATSAIEKMENIFKGIESTRDLTITLEDKINNIPQILDVITHISRQTDILALNATIEASKAGEHGKGFALVAEEVRRLADNTKTSVEDVSQIVRNIKAEMDRVVSSVSDGASFIKEGREDIRKVRDILGDIATFTAEVAEKANHIITITQKQKEKSQGTVELVEEVARIAKKHLSITEEVDSSVEQNSKSIENALIASEKLSILSAQLQAVVSKFRLEDNTEAERIYKGS